MLEIEQKVFDDENFLKRSFEHVWIHFSRQLRIARGFNETNLYKNNVWMDKK